MREVEMFAEVDGDGKSPPGMTGLGHVRAQLKEVKRRRPGSELPPIELGKTAHLLQQFHQFDFGSHHSFSRAPATAVHVPRRCEDNAKAKESRR
jgi:hypothetical protein